MPCWLPIVADRSVDPYPRNAADPNTMIAERSTTMSKDLERFVEDRTQLGKDRAAANAATFVMLDRDLGPVLNFQARNSGELRRIVCYENKAIAKSDGSNSLIVTADNLALRFKLTPDGRIVGRVDFNEVHAWGMCERG